MQTLSGRTCVFAGATAGDGIACVHALCAGGMNVVVTTHNAERAKALVEEIRAAALPGICEAYFGGDDGPAEERTETYEEIERRFGSVDVIISNTGATGSALSMEELTRDQLVHNMDHLVGGAFAMMKAALPCLRRSRAPRIILMTSVEGSRGGIHESFENAVAKGAVRALTLNAAARLAEESITVNAVAKGAIPRIEGIRPGDADPADFLPQIPMHRLGSSEDLAGTICFLASEESAYLTGQIIALDGGYSLRG
ncbi:MAG: SDR family oxidoreductase [Oscillospiraceae bacterium]|nr:SDR family oxidoreductase [Oscillospiraceae bacterium]